MTRNILFYVHSHRDQQLSNAWCHCALDQNAWGVLLTHFAFISEKMIATTKCKIFFQSNSCWRWNRGIGYDWTSKKEIVFQNIDVSLIWSTFQIHSSSKYRYGKYGQIQREVTKTNQNIAYFMYFFTSMSLGKPICLEINHKTSSRKTFCIYICIYICLG